MPIGNLTSQILANIYLHEFDRFVVHELKPLAYMRYGDDFLCFGQGQQVLVKMRTVATDFLKKQLCLEVNPKVDVLRPVCRGVSYLGVDIWPNGRRLQPKVRRRIKQRLNSRNAASYQALINAWEKPKYLEELNWRLIDE